MTDQPTPENGTSRNLASAGSNLHADKLGARIGLQGGVMDNQEVIWEEILSTVKWLKNEWLRTRITDENDRPTGYAKTIHDLTMEMVNPTLPPLPPSPEGQEWKRVEVKDADCDVIVGDIVLGRACEGWVESESDDTASASSYINGLAVGRGWVMRLVPIPVEWPKMLDTYWTETITAEEFAVALTWHDTQVERKWKERGIIHRTESEAVESCKARLGIP